MTDPWDWYIYLLIYPKFQAIHVGKYIVLPMDPSWGPEIQLGLHTNGTVQA